MDQPFPFGLPSPTAFYLSVYLLTLMIHIVFMNYVLAGSAYLAAHSVLRGSGKDESPLATVLRDWMPFMLSAAITAGIAPLLFLQVLYKKQFYTANLLLFHRWMAILPVLILAFYLAYLLKSKRFGGWPVAARAAVGCALFGCFAFVGWSWVENHLLSLQPQAWVEQYRSNAILFRSPELLPRLSLWFVAAFPTMALMVGWQLWYGSRTSLLTADASISNTELESATLIPGSRRTAAIAMVGILLSAISAAVYVSLMSASMRATLTGPLAFPYLLVAVAGTLMQLVAWIIQYRRACLARRWLILASLGLAVNFVGMAVSNESMRIATLDMTALYAIHERAARVGGRGIFLLFFAINFGLIGVCLRLVRRGLSRP